MTRSCCQESALYSKGRVLPSLGFAGLKRNLKTCCAPVIAPRFRVLGFIRLRSLQLLVVRENGAAVSFQNFLSPEGSVAADRFTIMERLFSLILDSG